LSEKLNLKPVGQHNTKGSQGHREKVNYAYIDALEIGGIPYLKTGTAIMDFTKSTEIGCLQIDGILGANTMRHSIWQIDYQKQEIIIASHIDSLSFLPNLDTIPFTTKTTGTPVLAIQMGKVIERNVTLDSGASGYIDLSNHTYQEVLKANPNVPHNFAYGNNSSGIYGIGAPDTLNFFKPDTLQFGTIELHHQICQASVAPTSSTLGTRFFKNYIITLDWNQNHLLLTQVKEFDYSAEENLGYKTRFIDDKMKVSLLYNGTEASKNLQLYEEVIQEDSTRYSTFTKLDYCKMISDTNKPTEKVTTILRDSIEITFPFTKAVFLR
tara:strand:+ start:2858 stop:3832 length:975 start_codon:yes stop_codon:yes gene_type:complete